MSMMTRLAAPVAVAGLALFSVPGGASAAEQASGYLDAVEDMPLMEGLHETGDGGVVFDKPNGRIIRSVATGKVAPEAVRRFYADALPQLGWTRAKKLELIRNLLVFRREGERLEIQTVPETGGMTEVRFSIEPE
ncbi:hypothetical protein [Parvibaculum sp.]|uniref:hypothetical protein n=1 Tax=Parvibaculum sp. TaxID=2024848 RepID=UPI002B938155|nr:hypothetical protein [Parvibaculum sp.]HUD50179.1 hypothetical protein [Parvibaculum sp.]